MAGAQAMGTAQSHDLLVVEAHSVEDQPEVRCRLVRAAHVCAGQAAILAGWAVPGRALLRSLVLPAGCERHLLATHLFDGNAGGINPEVRIRDRRELLLHRLQKILRHLQPRIGPPAEFRLKAHGGPARPASFRRLAVGAGGVPGQSNQQWSWCRPLVGRVLVRVIIENLDDLFSNLVPIRPLAPDGLHPAFGGESTGSEGPGAQCQRSPAWHLRL
mmetsp:Transcript_8056/g.19189  ORF Transcript_8056/g.19189 Transcript_8056/m.19189 type:complete len:216 (-) Transcript_8056:113-760(-)